MDVIVVSNNRCIHCGRFIHKTKVSSKNPICTSCFLKKCARIEEETGMFLGFGPVTDKIYSENDL